MRPGTCVRLALATASVLVASTCTRDHGDPRVRTELATVARLRSAFFALQAYEAACGDYPVSFAAVLSGKPGVEGCAYVPPEHGERDLVEAVGGLPTGGYSWAYTPGPLAGGRRRTFTIRAVYTGPPSDYAWREFVLTPTELAWERPGRLGGIERERWPW
jgi:hypothetical protein